VTGSAARSRSKVAAGLIIICDRQTGISRYEPAFVLATILQELALCEQAWALAIS
jgi:hypothetical protein